ncbi:MAG: hypothetical protein ABI666_07715 [Ferruginibacter sp.]
MKKKTNNTAGSKTQVVSANDYLRRAGKTTAQQFNTGKYYGNSGRGYGNDGNVYGEHEEDFYSHAMSA